MWSANEPALESVRGGGRLLFGAVAFFGGLFCLLSCSQFGERDFRIFRGNSSSIVELTSRVSLRIAKWVLVRREFFNSNLNDILFN